MPKSKYQKQNFKNGNVLMAEQLNYIESAIASKVDKVQGADHAGNTFIVDENGNVQLTPMPKSGEDGFSPTASVEETEDGAVIIITDKNGTTKATVKNGSESTGGGSVPDDFTPITTDEIDEMCSDGIEEEPVLIEEDDDAVEVQSPEEETV